jgi:SAM-dependent methyltransferase
VVSALEFVPDVNAVCREMARVLRPDGVAVVVTPGYHPVLDVALRLMTGERAEDTFQGRRQLVIPAMRKQFTIERTVRFPGPLWLYSALRGRP